MDIAFDESVGPPVFLHPWNFPRGVHADTRVTISIITLFLVNSDFSFCRSAFSIERERWSLVGGLWDFQF